MECAKCGGSVQADQAFCGVCGEPVAAPAPQPVPVPEPVAVTQPLPQQPAAPVYDPAAYEQQYAQPTYQPQPYPQQYAQPTYQQPPRKKKTGLIIAIVAVVLVFLIGGTVGGIFLVRALYNNATPTVSSSGGSIGGSTSEAPVTGEGYATPEEALAAVFEADWVFTLQADEGDFMTYWVGPPNSEYTDEVIVERMIDGSWIVTEDVPLDLGDMGGLLPEDEAVATVSNFLDLIMQDRPLEAQQLCISPFSEDPASAGYSNGDFITYEIVDVKAQEDMTFWVHTREEWRWGADEFEYYVVPTELGYFISELRPY